MINPDLCLDYYRETLHVGDFVIPIYDEIQNLGIKGTILNIDYIPELDRHYLTLEDESGNTYEKIFYSRGFSTKERKDIRDNKKYVYSLVCFNQKFKRISTIPLTNMTDINYSIPEETSYVTINADHLEEKGRRTKKEKLLTCYSYYSLYFFILKDKLTLTDIDHKDGPLLVSKEVLIPQAIGHNYKLFDNKDQLESFIKKVISYFNNADLTNINNNKEFSKNKTNLKFEDELVLKLKRSN